METCLFGKEQMPSDLKQGKVSGEVSKGSSYPIMLLFRKKIIFMILDYVIKNISK